MSRRNLIIGFIFLVAVGFGVFFVSPFLQRQWEVRSRSGVVLPPEEYSLGSSSSIVSSTRDSAFEESPRPAVNWDVPFTSQAPYGVWDALHKEACEEASVLMVLRYFSGEAISGPEDAEKEIQELVSKNESLGFPVDSTASEVRTLLLSKNPSLTVDLVYSPTIERMKEELSRGNLIIVPAAGRSLKNPYFTQPGPIYHMLVLRGYTEDGVYAITNDPGTKRGEEFVYTWKRLLFAIHDWNNGDPENGEKVVLVIKDSR